MKPNNAARMIMGVKIQIVPLTSGIIAVVTAYKMTAGIATALAPHRSTHAPASGRIRGRAAMAAPQNQQRIGLSTMGLR